MDRNYKEVELINKMLSLLPKHHKNSKPIKPTAEILKSFNVSGPEARKSIITPMKNDNEKVQKKMSSFGLNLNKLQDNISSDLKNQTNVFEEKKKNKMERLKSCRGSIGGIFNL